MNLGRTRCSQGFTVIDLLVTVATALILASLALGALLQAKAKAQRIQCLSNLRQLVIATLSYAGENGAFPLYQGYDPDLPKERSFTFWYNDLVPYLAQPVFGWKDLGVFECPASETGDWFFDSRVRYGYNASGSTQMTPVGLGGFWSSEFRINVCREANVKSPANMIALGDGIYAAPWSSDGHVGITDWLSWDKRMLQANLPASIMKLAALNERKRHRGGYSIAFCDGHIEFISAKNLFSSEKQAKRRWNTDNEPH
jgi:prepilin-type processing-associated H-X9-DG protein